MIGRNKRAERGRVSLFGHHLTIQEFTRGVVAFMYVTCGREKKSCVVYNRGEILVDFTETAAVLTYLTAMGLTRVFFHDLYDNKSITLLMLFTFKSS